MIVFDIILAILYILLVLIVIILVIALAIPLGILYGLYYLIFVKLFKLAKGPKQKSKSYEHIGEKFANIGRKQSKKAKGNKVNGREISDFVMKAIDSKKSGTADSEEFQKEVHEFVQKVKPTDTEEQDK